MLLSPSTQYAIIGLTRLGMLPTGGYCRVDDLIAGTSASRHALAKVFCELSKRRFLESVRGVGGGFRPAEGALDRPLMEVVEAIEGPWNPAMVSDRGLCVSGVSCPLQELLQPVGDQLERLLRETRVRDLLDGSVPHVCCCRSGQHTAGTPQKPSATSTAADRGGLS